LFGFVGASFAYMENKVFCTISPNSIIVTLDRDSNYKCTDYTIVLTQAINKEYKNVLAIQNLIKQEYDVEFWTDIRETKRFQIQRMLIIKQQIEDSVEEFEENMFDKTKEYMIYTTEPYRIRYVKLLKPLERLDDNTYLRLNVRTKIKLMQEQLDIISQISLAENFETLMKSFNRYVYLKNQIE
jgi:hypothetical protein